jgi:hypothetical protein
MLEYIMEIFESSTLKRYYSLGWKAKLDVTKKKKKKFQQSFY